MPIRFRKSIRIAPGVRINLTKRGVSSSIGVPGTGLSYDTGPLGRPRKGKAEATAEVKTLSGCAVVALLPVYVLWKLSWFVLRATVVALGLVAVITPAGMIFTPNLPTQTKVLYAGTSISFAIGTVFLARYLFMKRKRNRAEGIDQ